ncbi:hypothetical protein F2Q69_00036049 [Brassica cretica]|uniref:Uncharacterized protein n=1 Tax=Brassica cretica TaxID=69181 RepID=A0A8S9SSQ8_BRACR|nr:hypothetical protein F2Q69_00036049 [Brassica cretica]
MGRDASCLERSCVWSRMCAEVVERDRDASSSYLVRELVDWELKLDDLNLTRKSCWFGLGFQKTKTAPCIVSAIVDASEIGLMNGLH